MHWFVSFSVSLQPFWTGFVTHPSCSSDAVVPSHTTIFLWHLTVHLLELGLGCSPAEQHGVKAPLGFQCLLQVLAHCAMCSPVPGVLFPVLKPLLPFCRVSGNLVTTSCRCLNIIGFDLNIYISKFATSISRGRKSFVFFLFFPPELHFTLFFQNKISIASSFQGWVILNLSTSPGCLSLLPSYLSNY